MRAGNDTASGPYSGEAREEIMDLTGFASTCSEGRGEERIGRTCAFVHDYQLRHVGEVRSREKYVVGPGRLTLSKGLHMKLRDAVSDNGKHRLLLRRARRAFERFGKREIRFGIGERNRVYAVGLVIGRQGGMGWGMAQSSDLPGDADVQGEQDGMSVWNNTARLFEVVAANLRASR